ncbi:hypothetical protein [Pseudonocardia acaciae]|uniref:hypothetical protein n=1 Tax=Pseudonocardia acaciae TaxID=551276 RepID=UPI000688FEAD|nr:hypothetical protein [Pseudonocardia acaciae]
MTSRSVRRQEQLGLARSLRSDGQPWSAIAAVLRDRYEVNARVAMRLAHGWGQADAAAEWNRRWPDEPKTFKSFSYWENWPGDTGYTPSMIVLDRLAELYECDVTDLLTDWGSYRDRDSAHLGQAATESSIADSALESATLAWHVRNLDLQELTHAIGEWAQRIPLDDRRSLLLKLSTATAFSASSLPEVQSPTSATPATRPSTLAGYWTSRYTYWSSGRDTELAGEHRVRLTVEDGRLLGRSLPHPEGSELDLSLAVEGTVATGTWTERTSPIGYYRAATYRGVLQLVVDPTGRSMAGRWLGVSKRFTVKSGEWRLSWDGPSEHPDAHVSPA